MSSASNAARKLEPVVTAPSVGTPPPEKSPAPARKPRQTPERLCRVLTLLGLAFIVPLVRMAAGEDPRVQLRSLWRTLGIPLLAMVVFCLLWSFFASRIETSLGRIPGPAAVW